MTELAYDDGKFVLATITRLHDRKILLTYSDLSEMRAREREIDHGPLGEPDGPAAVPDLFARCGPGRDHRC